MHTSPLTHEQARELATNAIDFDLSATEWEQLDGHLAACDGCRRFAAATRRDQARLAALPMRDPPPRIHEALRRAEATRRDRTRPLLVLAAAGLTGVLAFATLGGGSQLKPADSPVASTAGASVAIVSPSKTPSPEPSVSSPTPGPPSPVPTESPHLPVDWAPVANQRSFHDPYGDIEAVAIGERLVAVGDGCGASLPTCHVAIWTSEDGETWDRVPDAPLFRAGDYTTSRRGELTDVVATDSGFLAVGRSREGGTRRAVVFWSSDGLRWTRSRDDASLLLGTMEAVISTPSGFIAVGNILEGTVARAGVWTSPDGLAWVRTTGDRPAFDVGGAGAFADGRIYGGMIDVAWTGNGAVAVGNACDVDGTSCHGVAWTSIDGRSWARETGELNGTPYSITATPSGLVAVGDDGQGRPRSWVSADGGATWTPGKRVAGLLGNFVAVVETPGGLVATIATTDLTSVVATSADGLTWQVAADAVALGPGIVNGLAWDPVRSLAIGVGWDGQTPAAAVWLGR